MLEKVPPISSITSVHSGLAILPAHDAIPSSDARQSGVLEYTRIHVM
jgi:hypothetical protein